MRTIRWPFAVAVVFAMIVAVGSLTAQTTPATQPQSDHAHPTEPAASGAAGHTAMSGSMMQMMQDMQAQDARLQELVVKMNAASGAEKSDAMAALLTALVAERPVMHQHMQHMMK